jgi:hypothetical protein
MAPNAAENNERPARPEPEQIRIPRVRQTARRSVGGRAPRKTVARVNGREIRRLVIEAHRNELAQQAQQQQQNAQQNEQASTSEETTVANGSTETKVVVK